MGRFIAKGNQCRGRNYNGSREVNEEGCFIYAIGRVRFKLNKNKHRLITLTPPEILQHGDRSG